SPAATSRSDADLHRPQPHELLDDTSDGAPQPVTEAAAVKVLACRTARPRRQVGRQIQLQAELVDQLVLLHGPPFLMALLMDEFDGTVWWHGVKRDQLPCIRRLCQSRTYGAARK